VLVSAILHGFMATVGMLAIGVLVWRLLQRQGHATPPSDDED
jgi:hypothetical protein